MTDGRNDWRSVIQVLPIFRIRTKKLVHLCFWLDFSNLWSSTEKWKLPQKVIQSCQCSTQTWFILWHISEVGSLILCYCNIHRHPSKSYNNLIHYIDNNIWIALTNSEVYNIDRLGEFFRHIGPRTNQNLYQTQVRPEKSFLTHPSV